MARGFGRSWAKMLGVRRVLEGEKMEFFSLKALYFEIFFWAGLRHRFLIKFFKILANPNQQSGGAGGC